MSWLYNYVNFDQFKNLPVIGINSEPYTEDGFDLGGNTEEIISLAPDVLVISKSDSVEVDDLQAKTGTPVVVVPGSDSTLDQNAYDTIRILGEPYGMGTGQLIRPIT